MPGNLKNDFINTGYKCILLRLTKKFLEVNNFVHPCNSLKRIFLYALIFYSMHLSAQESGHRIFQKSSQSFSSFKQSLRQDSVLSFHSRKGYFPSLIHNLGYQATFPLRMNEKKIFVLGSTALITLAFIHYDQEIDNFFQTYKR